MKSFIENYTTKLKDNFINIMLKLKPFSHPIKWTKYEYKNTKYFKLFFNVNLIFLLIMSFLQQIINFIYFFIKLTNSSHSILANHILLFIKYDLSVIWIISLIYTEALYFSNKNENIKSDKFTKNVTIYGFTVIVAIAMLVQSPWQYTSPVLTITMSLIIPTYLFIKNSKKEQLTNNLFISDEINKLFDLKEAEIITEEEFDEQKKKLLNK